jgi:hypothetical protein
MFEKTTERSMHRVRWCLTIGWLLLIFSLFYDPLSAWVTAPESSWSPLRVDPTQCEMIQGECHWDEPYPIGARLFWAAIVPTSIFILLTFGHELWRRVCPLSFLSQLPAALGLQRHIQSAPSSKGRLKRRVATVRKNSWLARNHLYLQFGLLYLGLCLRILFINAERVLLGSFLLLTIACAIAVGYWFGGKSWCHYFCPMAPVQLIFSEPRGLLTSKANTSTQSLTQSMCRTVDPAGEEKSACVGCQSPCIDIDSERSYWQKITNHDKKFIYYAYIGLVFGFYWYYPLYAGNWEYYFSGHWTHENQLAIFWNSGFYLFNMAIPIPRFLAVFFTLGGSSVFTYFIGTKIEKAYKAYLYRTHRYPGLVQLQHQIFTICTFIAFNLFFVFGGRPTILLLPLPIQCLYNGLIVFVSSLWFLRTWHRSYEIYVGESSKTLNFGLLVNKG